MFFVLPDQQREVENRDDDGGCDTQDSQVYIPLPDLCKLYSKGVLVGKEEVGPEVHALKLAVDIRGGREHRVQVDRGEPQKVHGEQGIAQVP